MTIYGYKMSNKGVPAPNEYDNDTTFLNAIKNHHGGHCVIMLHATSDNDIITIANAAPQNSTIIVVSEAVAAEVFNVSPKNKNKNVYVYLLNRPIPTNNTQDEAIVEAFNQFYMQIDALDASAGSAHNEVIKYVKQYIDGKTPQEERKEAFEYLNQSFSGTYSCDD